jgi:hypothetical protein
MSIEIIPTMAAEIKRSAVSTWLGLSTTQHSPPSTGLTTITA